MDDSIIGTTVDGYRIQEMLGRGGMGVVYKARDVSLARDVALKRITPELANDEPFLRRFRAEAQALARLESPHIVSVYALRQTEIGLLIVMEYIEGGTVNALIRQGAMLSLEALPFIEQTLAGLEHAHGADVVHRDIKPANILLTQSGAVKVTDFGLAKVYRADSARTVTQGVHGTLKYMSPEQVKGRADLDHRSDLYSLGMTVYEMLAGRLPFDEDDSEYTIMRTIAEETLPPPNRYRSGIPDALVEVVMTSLAKEPGDRFEDAGEMRDAFEAAAAEQEAAQDTTAAEVVRAAGLSDTGMPRLRVAGVGLLIVLAAISGYLMYEMMLVGGEAKGEASSAAEPSVSTTALSIETEPGGATVYQSGRRIGITPLEYSIEDDSAHLRIQKAGFLRLDTTLGLNGEPAVDVEVQLTKAVSRTTLTVTTDPSGASVYHEGNRVGTTPLDYAVDGDRPLLRVRKEGYAPVDTVPTINGAEKVRLEVPLAPVDPDSVPAPHGALDLAVHPAGAVFVDGERYENRAAIEVPMGRHHVRFEHPEYGGMDTTIAVEEGQTEALTYYFEQTIRVRSTERQGTVLLGGTSTGASLPHELLRGPGTYRVGLRLPDDSPQTVSGGIYRQTVDDREGQKVEFSGNEREVRIAPSFSPTTHVVTFRVRSVVEQVRGRIDGLKQAMKRAIVEQKWDLLPGRLAQSCRDALEALYDKHEITSVRVVANDVRRAGERVELPFETYITYRQKGREGTKYIPLSVVTVWSMQSGDARLVDVRRTELGER